jgi:excisionase family DNA binding protein
MAEVLLTLDVAAERLSCSRKMVYDWVRSGRITGVKLGRLWRIKESDLDLFIEALNPVGSGDDPRENPDREGEQ